MAVITRHKNTVYGLVTDLSNLATADATETARAKGIEGLISTGAISVAGDSFTDITSALIAIDTAVAGSTNVQAVIDSLDAEIARAEAAEDTLTTAISTETTRATTAENTISDNLAIEVARATAVEATLNATITTEVTTARTAEDALNTAITTETTRAVTTETYLQSEIDATNTRIASFGNAFAYVGQINAGVDADSAYDMETLPTGEKDAGDYYKVISAGYVKVGIVQAPFYVDVNDGLVFNLGGTIDKIDNANSQVFGTTNEVTVTGSAATGFTVSIDPVFSDRVSALETGLTTEATTARAAEDALNTAITTEATTARDAEDALNTAITTEVARATDAEATKLAIDANLSDVANVVTARTNLGVYSTTETDNAIRLGGAIRAQEMLTVTSDKIVLTYRPKQDIVLNFSTVRYTDSNNVSYDIPVTMDTTDVSGLTWNLYPDSSGQFDSYSVMVQYDYVATV